MKGYMNVNHKKTKARMDINANTQMEKFDEDEDDNENDVDENNRDNEDDDCRDGDCRASNTQMDNSDDVSEDDNDDDQNNCEDDLSLDDEAIDDFDNQNVDDEIEIDDDEFAKIIEATQHDGDDDDYDDADEYSNQIDDAADYFLIDNIKMFFTFKKEDESTSGLLTINNILRERKFFKEELNDKENLDELLNLWPEYENLNDILNKNGYVSKKITIDDFNSIRKKK
jgi:hypothetical protein